MSKGFLVSLEGPEGAGKTSVLEALIPILEDRGVEVLTTREPGGVLIGEKIREVILDPSHTEMDPKTELSPQPLPNVLSVYHFLNEELYFPLPDS